MAGKVLNIWFGLLSLLLLAPWPIAYAYDNGVTDPRGVQIEKAEPSATPTMNVFGRAIGSVNTGDLFYVDNRDSSVDTVATIYLTNADELSHHYRYLTLKLGLYAQNNDGAWDKPFPPGNQPIPDTYLTLRNGQVDFMLSGYTRYRITVEGGCFYCFTGNADSRRLAPQFYLTVEQA